MVPSDWKEATVSEISNSVKVGFVGTCQKYYRDEGIPLIRTTNLREGKLDLQDVIYVTKDFHAKNKKSQLREFDLLIARHGKHGSACMVPEGFQEANCLNIVIVRPNLHLVQPEYLLDLFNFSLSAKLSSKAAGSTQTVVNTKEIAAQKLTIPPLPEQQKIAKVLTTWDKAINTTERLIENSKQQKKALMQQLLTGQKRLPDDSGQRFSGDWEEGKLADFAKIKKGKALSSKDIKKGSYPVIAGGKSSPYSHNDYTHENIITVSASGAYAGYVAFFDYKIWASDCSVIEPKVSSDIKYLYYWLKYQQPRIYNLQSGGAQPHVYPKDLEGMKISLPSEAEQQKIAAALTNADREIEVLEQQLADLQQEKKALMQQLLTGKKRVKVY